MTGYSKEEARKLRKTRESSYTEISVIDDDGVEISLIVCDCGSKQSAGLGDTVASVLKATHLNKLSEVYEAITGKPCNCHKRQETLNKMFPYGSKVD